MGSRIILQSGMDHSDVQSFPKVEQPKRGSKNAKTPRSHTSCASFRVGSRLKAVMAKVHVQGLHVHTRALSLPENLPKGRERCAQSGLRSMIHTPILNALWTPL